MKTILKLFAVFAVIGVLAGCARTAPIDQVVTTVAAGHTKAEVKNAILKAGIQRQWIMTEEGENKIKGRQQSRDHVAEVSITYSATSYAIIYENSSNLMASGGKIHKNYNRWVRNLDKDIQINLSAAKVGL